MDAIRVANAPCSWGDLGIEGLEGESIGYQQMLDELVETGYIGTDLGDWGYMPTDPDNQIFALLKILGTLGLLLVAFPVSLSVVVASLLRNFGGPNKPSGTSSPKISYSRVAR